jgi:ATP-dependent DNA helicase Q1
MTILNMKPKSTYIFAGSLNRPNLFYNVVSKPANAAAVIQMIVKWIENRYLGQKGIIYCLSKRDAEKVAMQVQQCSNDKIRCVVYHSDVQSHVKTDIHERWRTGDIDVVVATIAFGTRVFHFRSC